MEVLVPVAPLRQVRQLTRAVFNSDDAPKYLPGIRAVLGVFSAMMVAVILSFVLLFFLNKQRARQRVAHGKPANIRDTSMTTRYETYGTEGGIGKNGTSWSCQRD